MVFSLTKQHIQTILQHTVPFDKMKFQNLAALACRLNATLSVYDTETSNFRNTWNFGITELSMLHINTDGSMYIFSSLFNPCYPITPIVAEKTGITDAMVKNAPKWKDLGAPIFHYLANKGNYLLGYNNRRFDRGCIIDSNALCGSCGAVVPLEREYDIYPMTTTHFGRNVKLEDASKRFGLNAHLLGGDFHRATNDVIATAFVAERLLASYGPDMFLEYVYTRFQKKNTPQRTETKQASLF